MLNTQPQYDKTKTVNTERKDVGTGIVVGVNDGDAARRRRDQIIAGNQNVETTYQSQPYSGGNQSGLYGGGGNRTPPPPEPGTGTSKTVDTARSEELRLQMEDAELSRVNREIDMAQGRARGELDFSSGSLGRVGEDTSSEMQQLQESRLDIANNGFGAAAFQAAREQGLQGMQRDQQQQDRSLKAGQASSGVFGALGGAQSQALMGQQQRETQEAERKLFLDQVGQKQQSLGLAEQTVRGNEADTLQRQQYNMAQNKAEIMGRLTAQYGEAALGVAERSSAASAQAAKDYANAVKNQGGGKK